MKPRDNKTSIKWRLAFWLAAQLVLFLGCAHSMPLQALTDQEKQDYADIAALNRRFGKGGFLLKDRVVADLKLTGLQLEQAIVQNARLEALDLSGSIIRNSKFEAVDLSGCDLSNGDFENVQFIQCDLTGV